MGEVTAPGAGHKRDRSRDGRLLQFGAFELKTGTGEIRKHGVRVRLQGKPFQLLEALLERPGQVVTREELRDRLWAVQTFVDFESGLNTAVNRLRLALGDSADSPRYVETVARNGYRFVAPVIENHLPSEEGNGLEEPAVALISSAPIPISPVADMPRRSSARWWILISAALVVATVSAVVLRQKPAQPEFHQVSFRRMVVRAARFGPDGHSVIYDAGTSPTTRELYLADTVSPESRPLGFKGVALAAVSGTGELALLGVPGPRQEWSLVRVPVNGGAPLPLDQSILAADWSPDSSKMAVIRYRPHPWTIEYPRGTTIYRSGGWLSDVRVSPSGREVAFIDHPLRLDDGGNVIVIDADRKSHTLSTGWASAQGLAWSPTGREVWFSAARSGLTRAIYANTLAGKLRMVAAFPGTLTLCDISNSGRVLISREQPHAMMSIVRDGTTGEQDLSWFDYTNVQDISADGQVVLFGESGEGGGAHHAVYIRRANAPAAIRVGDGFAMAISPDAKWVVTRPDGDQASLRLTPLEPGEPRTLSDHNLKYDFARFFPDGTRLLVGGSRAGGPLRLYIESLDGSAPVPLATEEYLARPAISEDGRQIAGVDSEQRLVILPVAGGEPKVIATAFMPTILRWSYSGTALLAQAEGVPSSLLRVDTASGRYKPWRQIAPSDLAGVSFIWPAVLSRDEHTIVYSFLRNLSELFVVDGWR